MEQRARGCSRHFPSWIYYRQSHDEVQRRELDEQRQLELQCRVSTSLLVCKVLPRQVIDGKFCFIRCVYILRQSDSLYRLNPYKVDMYDGVNLTPLEVMFVKVKDYMLQANWAASKTSQAYDRWSSHEV